MAIPLSAVLFALVSYAAAMGPGPGGPGGPIGAMMDMVLGPPATLTQCMDRMTAKMQIKVKLMEEMMEAKWQCKEQCLSDDLQKCMPEESFKEELKNMHKELKTKFMEAKDKADKCIKENTGEEKGCSDKPKRWGLCGLGIAKTMVGKETKMCAGKCMMDKIKTRVMEFVVENVGKDGFPDLKQLAKMKGFIEKKTMMFKGKGGKGKGKGYMKMEKIGMMMAKKFMGPCITQFCEVDTLHECAKSSGLMDMFLEKKKMKVAMMEKIEEKMFPTVCECMKKAATNLPDYLKSFDCAREPNTGVCDLLHVDWVEKMAKKFEEMGPPKELASRRKREVEHAFDMAEEAELMDAFDFE